MKIYPMLKNSELCESRWEKYVMWRLEVSDRSRLGYLFIAIIWTILWVASGPDRPFLFNFLFVFSWIALYWNFVSSTFLKLMERTKLQAMNSDRKEPTEIKDAS